MWVWKFIVTSKSARYLLLAQCYNGKQRNRDAWKLSSLQRKLWAGPLFRSASVSSWWKIAAWVATYQPQLLVFSLLCSFLPCQVSLVMKLALVWCHRKLRLDKCLSFCIASPWDTPSQNPAVTLKEAQLVMWRSHMDEIPDPRWHPLTGHPRNSQHHLASHVCEQISWAESSPSSQMPRGTEAGSQSLSCQQM